MILIEVWLSEIIQSQISRDVHLKKSTRFHFEYFQVKHMSIKLQIILKEEVEGIQNLPPPHPLLME